MTQRQLSQGRCFFRFLFAVARRIAAMTHRKLAYIQVAQAELMSCQDGARVHPLEILDDLKHAHMSVPLDKGFELGNNRQ
jgi:hypothetical protein